jgi:methyltransferase (TIGR00027 family)
MIRGKPVSGAEPLIRDISDTARWAAVFRARETDRPDAVFRDPFARRLAGARGEPIADNLVSGNRQVWAWVTRTYLFDQFISEQVVQGADMVVNLAAGLDARPYRMNLPPSLQWVEVDLPDLVRYKEEILQGEQPVCLLERIGLDLADKRARRELFDQLAEKARRVLILSEGLLLYLDRQNVGALAEDLARPASFQRWVFDLASPGLLLMLQRQWQQQLEKADAPLQFAPPEGPHFFSQHGWQTLEVRSILKTAAQLKRLSFGMRLLAKLPESSAEQGRRPWSGICLLENKSQSESHASRQ